jgi:SAM-dependent methyltransferase
MISGMARQTVASGNPPSFTLDMRVRRDFDRIYAVEDDPWGIGDADSERYDLYVDRIVAASRRRDSILELGCGYGALLARLSPEFGRAVGVDVSARAIERGQQRFRSIEFVHGSLADLEAALPTAGAFDTIVVSDVLYYLKERDRRAALTWIAAHLASDGLAFLAGWSPGGRYLSLEEFRNLVLRELRVEREEVLDTGHVLFVARRQRTMAAMTVDYETWQPQLDGVPLDWEADVFRPTERLLEVFEEAGATLTIFAEMGEYLWLCENRPQTAHRMEAQWRELVQRGHDVQLHLHPNWLPDMNPEVVDGKWRWDMDRTRAADYPGDLTAAIARCRVALERAIRPVAPDYRVTSFRAGTYEAQPFDRLCDALVANRIEHDSSVVPGDNRPGRHYDYRHALSDHQPWFASRYDPQLEAPRAERQIIELPVFTPEWGERWTFDNEQGALFARRLVKRLARARQRPSSEQLRRRSARRERLRTIYASMPPPTRLLLNRLIPRALAPYLSAADRDRVVGARYYVLVSHTKVKLDIDAISAGLKQLGAQGVELVSLSELAKAARTELAQRQAAGGLQADAISAARHPAAATKRLIATIPLDRQRLLALDRKAASTAPLALAGRRSETTHASLEQLPVAAGQFDCVLSDGALSEAADVDRALADLHGALAPQGCLVAAIRPEGVNGRYRSGTNVWRTTPADARTRLRHAGFVDVEVSSVDTFRELGELPFPPADDQMLYIRAWKRATDMGPLNRVTELTRWAYGSLDPAQAQTSNDPVEILAGGFAWCWGYVVVLGEALSREGFDLRWVTMVAEGHPLGVGPTQRDSHEVLEVALGNGRRVVCDPMVGIVFESSLAQLLSDPSLADTSPAQDDRYRSRNYALYSTSAWYRVVRSVAVRRRPGGRLRYVDAERVAQSG